MGVRKETKIRKESCEKRAVFWRFVLAFFVVWLWLGQSYDVLAEEQLYFDEEGNLHMTTHDRIATNNITYKTIGWRIKRYNQPMSTPGNDSIVVVMQDGGSNVPDPDNPEYQYCYFTCDKETIFKRIGEVSAEWQEELYLNGGYVYFDAFMTICENGVPKGGLLDEGNSAWGFVYDTFETISTAAPWRDPQALRTHFDKQVYFGGNASLLSLTCKYEVESYECMDGEFLPLTRFGMDWSGELNGTKEKVEIRPADLSRYDFSYISACVEWTRRDGSITQYWTQELPVTLDNSLAEFVSIRVNLYYKRRSWVSTQKDSWHMQDGAVVMEEQCLIGAGTKEQQTFDVADGVPSGEDLYIDGRIYPFGFEITYENHYGYQTMPVHICAVYTGHWIEMDGTEKTEQMFCDEVYYIDRAYSYWCIADAEIYTLEKIEVENEVFEEGKILFKDCYTPDIVFEQKTSHIRNANEAVYWIDGGVLEGDGKRPDIPKGSWQAQAAEMAGYYMVCNDVLSINGEVFLAGNECGSQAGGPKRSSDATVVNLYKDALTIPAGCKNGRDYKSTGKAFYCGFVDKKILEQKIEDINAVTVHTPVVCHAFATDEKQYNQLCKPNAQCYSWILGRNFEIGASFCGAHLEQMGYGTQDYSRYVLGCEVKFPFEVYRGEQYYAPGEWIELEENSSFYLPTGVMDGVYRVLVRCRAYNCEENEEAMERLANLTIEKDTAYDELMVQVCPRMYGMRITDIQRECWYSVFYKEDGARRGCSYPVGLYNMNGELVRSNSFFTCPVLAGGYPLDEKQEGEALGTVFSYELETIGSYSKEDGIFIEPEFYVMDKNGKNRRRVELYHFEKSDGNGTWENVRSNEKSGLQYLDAKARKNIGKTERNVADVVAAQESVQQWSGEFQIPEDIYVVEYGTNLEDYIAQRGSISVGDSIFIKGGYLMVQFIVHAKKAGELHQSYTNEENEVNGYANMWKIEGFENPRKKADGTEFTLQYGDIFLYDLSRRISQEHRVVGTH